MGKYDIKVTCPDCGATRTVDKYSHERTGHSYCRPCSHKRNFKKQNKYIGKKFGKLKIIGDSAPKYDSRGAVVSMVVCKCECGTQFSTMRSAVLSGNTKSCGCTKGLLSGSEHPNYKPNKTQKERNDEEMSRKTFAARMWSKKVREVGECFICGSRNNLIAHHLRSFAKHPELRYDECNGVCLCKGCHNEYHYKFLGGPWVPATFDSFDRFVWSKWK